jgi:phosphoribosylformimino-5-aminoimidazole carboxamide ribotide isomerase/imidazole glycerol phosphate synthase glutamine amidotransferase subunit
MIAMLDTGSSGNAASVANAFLRSGVQVKTVKSLQDPACFDGLVIPGVGSFSTVPRIAAALGGKKAAKRIGVPVLCICLGMQSLFDSSEEAPSARGMGVIPGKVRRISGAVRLPQLGWNKVGLAKEGKLDPLFAGIGNCERFYFANSFAAFPSSQKCVLGSTEYGGRFASAVRAGNFWGVQFHPEKSGKAGQRLIGNFVSICRKWGRGAIPSIDVLEGRAVRLRQGKQGTEEFFGDPLLLARKYEKAGFSHLHVVDMDAVFGGESQLGLLRRIARKCPGLQVQWAGGVRSIEAAKRAFSFGASRVVFGTLVATSPATVRKCAEKYGEERVWASLDFSGKPPRLRVNGWRDGSKIGMLEAIRLAESCKVGGLIISSVDADGMGNGPDLALAASAAKLSRLPFLLAGGIRSPSDAKGGLSEGAQAAIVGRALYDKKIKTGEWACL